MIDITDQVEADRVTRAAELRFEIGFKQSTIGAAITDLNGLPVRVNPAACLFFERPPDQLIGRRWTDYTHPDEMPLGQSVLGRLAGGHDTYADERRYLRPDGSIVWALTHVTLVRDEKGERRVLLRATPRHHRSQGDGAGARPSSSARFSDGTAEQGAADRSAHPRARSYTSQRLAAGR